ncbi:type II 3-dehydroquinate dehydratase [Roseomonas elaeocarpi]|uniref:3-dehydroquinate dehydratase n=1 Tax=Roseomonas elaeocarpi TaxID=907779 RepID=A0ABV6JNT1_9PROT
MPLRRRHLLGSALLLAGASLLPRPAGAAPGRTVFVLNGPNLDLLGQRQPELYGHRTLADVEKLCRDAAARLRLEIVFRHTNSEGQLVDWIHEARSGAAAIVINPAAYAHTSVAVMDALEACDMPKFEVHITNTFHRESFRHTDYVAQAATGVVDGLGIQGYALALERVAQLLEHKQ